MKKNVLIALIAAMAAPLAAHAEGAYIGGNVGRAEQKVDLSGFSLKEHDTAYKVYGGFNYTPNFGAEIGAAYLGEAEKTGNGARISSKAQSLYVAATATLPLGEQFALTGKAGAAFNHVKVRGSAPGYSASGSDNQTSPYVSVGASFLLNKNVSFVAEYEYFGKIAKDGDANIKANLVSAGVRYAF
ncbi:outer membrane beta-barrel protein [Duganella sp. sic0402]|uniref:outer membrane beta-barrel protein n=1 Tax=Duganella sp. sic0402 TaxID=2854786 RepID=UPI001C48D65B|nr:outer membrane beta-barrel protein [Duganella sp. sic0402]MBV7535653.1 outer membrane beta-barrel protein [Duganella sp. sic0402]